MMNSFSSIFTFRSAFHHDHDGLALQISATIFFFGYLFLMDGHYLNHLYLACLISFLIIWMPLNRSFSLDSKFFPQIKSDAAPVWCLWLLRFQMGIVYFYGGIAKIESDWLAGKPMAIWLSNRSHYPIVGQYLTDPVILENLAIFYAWNGMFLTSLSHCFVMEKKQVWICFYHLVPYP